MAKETPAPIEWHKLLGKVGGELSLAITRRALKGPALESWITDLRSVADQMETFKKENVDGKRKADHE